MTGGERAVFDHWLDLYRDTVFLKIAGLDAGRLHRMDEPRHPRAHTQGEAGRPASGAVHLIEEYARHLGHMDLLREAIDGRTGY